MDTQKPSSTSSALNRPSNVLDEAALSQAISDAAHRLVLADHGTLQVPDGLLANYAGDLRELHDRTSLPIETIEAVIAELGNWEVLR